MTCVRSGLAALVAYLAVHVLGVVVRGILGAAVLLQVRKSLLGLGVLSFWQCGSSQAPQCCRCVCGGRGSPRLPLICWCPCVARGGALCCQRITQSADVVMCDVCWCRSPRLTGLLCVDLLHAGACAAGAVFVVDPMAGVKGAVSLAPTGLTLALTALLCVDLGVCRCRCCTCCLL
jgi:hypothetical protein